MVTLAFVAVRFVLMLDAPQNASSPIDGNAAKLPSLKTLATSDTTSAPIDGNAATLPSLKTLATSDTTSATSPVDTGACDGDVVDSPSVQFRWGIMQLETKFTKANALCKVKVLQYPNDRSTSISINQYVLPIYIRESLASKSAHIDGISGATYSWQAYSKALQAVLDKR